ncbi:MAG: sigma-70 family RNA polymerase sigma factor [Pirellulaceae bacterium]
MTDDPEKRLCDSWSVGRLRPWLQMIADRELPDRLRGRVDASDIVQQTLLKAWRGESQFNGQTHEQRLAWLRMIVKNTIRDQQRRLFGTDKRDMRREQLAGDVFADGDPGLDEVAVAREPSVSAALIDAEQRLALERSLMQLSSEHRRVIELRHFKDLSFAEIADEMNKSEPAIRMLWVRALRNLQKINRDGSELG